MSSLEPDSDNPSGQISPRVSEDAVRRLAEAVAHLANDPDYFLQALTDMLMAVRPVTKNRHTEDKVRFLIESGDFTAETWAEISASVARGSLQLSETEDWLMALFATRSLEDVTGFLGWSEEAVQAAVAEKRLYAIEISGRLRFPSWQFNVGSPEKLIPELTEIIEVVTLWWGWRSVAGFMNAPQSSLVTEGRKTPAQWLRDGGDVDAIRTIVESDDSW